MCVIRLSPHIRKSEDIVYEKVKISEVLNLRASY